MKPKTELLPEKPKRNRRIVLKTLNDARRESAFIYRAMAHGKLSLEAGDIMSRVIGRHHLIVAAGEQAVQLTELVEQLKALQGGVAVKWDLLEPET